MNLFVLMLLGLVITLYKIVRLVAVLGKPIEGD